MKIDNVKVYGLQESIIRSGHPMRLGEPRTTEDFKEADTIRAIKLGKAKVGTGHDTWMKGVIVQFDLRYPELISPQLQRYNWVDIISSQSKMHMLSTKELSKDDFGGYVYSSTITQLNVDIEAYKTEEDKGLKLALELQIQDNLPLSYMKWMGISTNYMQLKTIYFQRKNHKRPEWQVMCKWIEELPMMDKLLRLNSI